MSENVFYLGGKPEPVHKKAKFHSIEACNFWVRRNGVCPYCMSGSKAVHKSLIDSDGNWVDSSIKELKEVRK